MATAKVLKIVQKGDEVENAIDLSEALKRTNTPRLLLKQKDENNLSKNFDSDDEDILPLGQSFSVNYYY